MQNKNMKHTIYTCISNILSRENTEYVQLNEIYKEVANYLETENNLGLQSQIRGRLQENCEQYSNFKGDPLFLTEKIRSGKWTIKKDRKKYIRYTHNKYLITDDNWATLIEDNFITPDYALETNLDNVYKAKLIKDIGSQKAKIIVNELNKIRKLLKKIKNINKTNDGYGNAFEVFAISTEHKIEYEECINKYIIHGDNDGKIDAIYYGEKDYFFIYQIKTENINENEYETMKKNYGECIRNKIPEYGKDLYNFVKANKDKWRGKTSKYISIAKNSNRDTNLSPKYIYNKFFENKMTPDNYNNLLLTITKPKQTNDNSQFNVSKDENNNFTFFIKASELKDNLLKSLGITINNHSSPDLSKFFYDNVRGTLVANKKMVYTIQNEPVNFVKYNNGINITGEVKDLGEEIEIKNPIINNGQQTITTLLNVNENLDQIILSIKITNETNNIIKGKISQYSNEQVKVKAIDMLSLNQYIRDIQKVILNNTYKKENYFLEIYSSGKKEYEQMKKEIYDKRNIISLLEFIKLYFSVKDNKNLGAWKNNPNAQVEKTIINSPLDENLSFQVCEATATFNKYIDTLAEKKEKEDFKSADLAFKYLICTAQLEPHKVAQIINRINQKYFYNIKEEKSKLIDVYKSTTIIKKLNEELELYLKEKCSKTEIK